MMKKVMMAVIVTSVLSGCSLLKHEFKYKTSSQFYKKAKQYSPDDYCAYGTSFFPKGRVFFLGIDMEEIFLSGERTITFKEAYDVQKEYLQYCYFAFTPQGDVIYETQSASSISSAKKKMDIKNEVHISELGSEDKKIMQGIYFIKNDTTVMMLLEHPGKGLIRMEARLGGRNMGFAEMEKRLRMPNDQYLVIDKIVQRRSNYSPLRNLREGDDAKYKTYLAKDLFSIDMSFVALPDTYQCRVIR